MKGPAILVRGVAAVVAFVAAALAAVSHEVLMAGSFMLIAVLLAMAARPVLGPVFLALAAKIGQGVLEVGMDFGPEKWILVVLVWLLAWSGVALLSEARPAGRLAQRSLGLIAPAVFGITLLWLWEAVVLGTGVSPVILPAPSAIGAAFADSRAILWADFLQTTADRRDRAHPGDVVRL